MLSPTINWKTLAAQEFSLPQLEKQRRIAGLLSGIESAAEAIQDLEYGLEQLRKSFIIDRFSQLLEDDSVARERVAQAGEILMGRQRAPQYDQGISPRPYLRVANVYDGYIDTSDVKQMDFSNQEFEQYRLRTGDVLLNEGQSRELVGRSCVFRGEVSNCCFQNTLLRFRPNKTSPEYAHHYFQYCLYNGEFIAISKQTTSIAHLGANRLASMEFPIPGPEQESEIVSVLSQIEASARQAAKRKEYLRRLKNLVFAESMSPALALESVGQ